MKTTLTLPFYDHEIKDDPHEINFNVDGNWIMKLTHDGVKFNRERFKDLTEDEFTENIISVLESNFEITFKKRRENE